MPWTFSTGNATATFSGLCPFCTHPCPLCGSYDTVRSGDVLLCNVCAKREAP